MYKIPKIVKCITNKNKKGEHLPLIINKEYKVILDEKDMNSFMLIGEDKEVCYYKKDYFEVVKYETKNNTGFSISVCCNDCNCVSEVKHIEELKNYKCWNCGQELK